MTPDDILSTDDLAAYTTGGAYCIGGNCVHGKLAEYPVKHVESMARELWAARRSLRESAPHGWQDMTVMPPERVVLELAWKYPSWTDWRLTLAEFVHEEEGWYWIFAHDPEQWVVEDDVNEVGFLWKLPMLPAPLSTGEDPNDNDNA